jgi:hypothetical protein
MVDSLRESFAVYWPTFGDTGAHERNVSLHLAHSFLGNGFEVFGEGHCDGSANRRYDLVAYDRRDRFFVVTECKQLWSKETVRDMHNDLERIQKFTPVLRDGPFRENPGGITSVGLLTGLIEGGDRLRQWQGEVTARPCPVMSDLLAALGETKAVLRVGQRLCEHGRHPSREGRGFFLTYAMFPVEGGGKESDD